MKKLLLAFIAGIALLGSVKAQTEYTIGPKVGLNVSNISHSHGNSKASVNVGIFGEARFTDLIGLQLEVLYSRQGWRDKVDIDGIREKVNYRVNYLNIPVLARIYVLERLSVDLGPQLGIGLNAKSKYKHSGTTVKEKLHDLNTIEASFVFGVSYDLFDHLLISARYNLGLSNAFDKDTFGKSNKNGVFQFSVGYKFNW